MADARDVVRDQALEIAAGWSAPTAPRSWALTATMLRTIADEPAVLDLAAQIPLDKLPPLLLSAATRHLIGELRSDLARYFPSAGSSQPVLDAGFAPAFREFCLDHSEELLALCQKHRYQMNEVARCTQLALALEVVRQHWPRRALALIDVGTGAGLALHLDRYRYRIGDALVFGDPTSALEMRCELRGKLRPPHPEHLPAIAARVGVDRDPIDLTDMAARSWLESCVPPEADSITRFVRAASIATRDSVTLIAGDGAERYFGSYRTSGTICCQS